MTVIYVDMDGVLAEWDPKVKTEDTHKKGFFLSCKEEKCIKDAVKKLKEKYKIKILSHTYGEWAMKEKAVWLENIGLEDIEKVFVPYGKPKSDFVNRNEKNVLIDDYSKNLHDWVQNGFVGIKFRNKVNGNNGTWNGPSINYSMTANEIVDRVESILSQM